MSTQYVSSMWLLGIYFGIEYVVSGIQTGAATLQNSSFSRSRWFTRSWTLQELLAPKELVFVGSDWAEIGTKRSLQVMVSAITQIDVEALDKQSWPEYSIAQKMSWPLVGRPLGPRTKPTAYWASSMSACLCSTARVEGRSPGSNRKYPSNLTTTHCLSGPSRNQSILTSTCQACSPHHPSNSGTRRASNCFRSSPEKNTRQRLSSSLKLSE